jgi:hypothetical protein
VKELLHNLERLCLTEQDDHWRSFQTARAVAYAAHARVLLVSREGSLAISAARTALAAQPDFAGAHQLLAEAYMTLQDGLAKDWASRAKEELLLALRSAPTCKQIRSWLAALYASDAMEQASEAERMYRQLGELPSLSFVIGQLILNTPARECPAFLAIHQYLAACSGLRPASRKRLEAVATEARSRNLCGVALAQHLLAEIEAAGVALSPRLLEAARGQLASRVASQAATA